MTFTDKFRNEMLAATGSEEAVEAILAIEDTDADFITRDEDCGRKNRAAQSAIIAARIEAIFAPLDEATSIAVARYNERKAATKAEAVAKVVKDEVRRFRVNYC